MQTFMLAGCALLYRACLQKPLDVLAADAPGLMAGSVWGVPIPVVLFSGLIMLSRIGMWSFEMVDTQLFQMVRRPCVLFWLTCIQAHHDNACLECQCPSSVDMTERLYRPRMRARAVDALLLTSSHI